MSIRRAVHFACLWVWITARSLRLRPTGASAGQGTAEFALICFFIALFCIPALNILRETFVSLHIAHQTSLGGPVHLPTPTRTP